MRKILIIGASASIGNEIIKNFLLNGDIVYGTYNYRKLKINSFNYSQPKFDQTKLDINCNDSQNIFIKKIKRYGKFDVVIFLPALLLGKSLKEYKSIEINEVIETNFISQASLLQKLMPKLKIKASIIFLSSISGQRGSYDPIYAASKAAQIGFIKSLALWEGSKLRVNGVAPSLIYNSSMFKSMSKKRREHHTSQSPTGKLTTKKEIAKIIFDICGDDWKNVSGQIISVNGGIL
jgi:3-oxoacyl-[acyl-carrier protein] reductase